MSQSQTAIQSEALKDNLQEKLRQVYGAATRVVGVRHISRRAAVSARVQLEGSGNPRFVFVKHVFPECYPARDLPNEHVEFAEELLAQRFLENCPSPQPYRPKLITFDERGFFVLEYLGDNGYAEERTFGYLIPRIALALAMQHSSTMGHEEKYDELRRESGLGAPSDDKRRYGGPAQQWRFNLGRAYLLREAGERGLASSAFDQEIEEAAEFVACPGQHKAFIHDDLGNARQTFELNDRLYLLDYEYARYGPGLLDLCKPMLGKFELNLSNDNYFWNSADFPNDLATAYRQALLQAGVPSVSDEEWFKALASSQVFHSLTLIGRLMHLEPDRRLVGSIQQNVNGILFRLFETLPDETQPALKGFCKSFLGLPDTSKMC